MVGRERNTSFLTVFYGVTPSCLQGSLEKSADTLMDESTEQGASRGRNQEGTRPSQRASGALGPRPPREAVGGTAVYVMLPLDTVSATGQLQHVKALEMGLHALKKIGVDGVMVDVWWGVVERNGPVRSRVTD